MDALLLKDIQRTVKETPKPYSGFDVATVEYPDGLITLRIYENQIMGFSEDQRANILLYLEKMQTAIRAKGLRCEMEGVAGDAPSRRGR
jgi:hypothetical protein